MTKRKARRAKVFWSGRSQVVRLPKEFRFDTDTVLVRREGESVVLGSPNDWPDGYVDSFAGAPEDFTRPRQGEAEDRERTPASTQ